MRFVALVVSPYDHEMLPQLQTSHPHTNVLRKKRAGGKGLSFDQGRKSAPRCPPKLDSPHISLPGISHVAAVGKLGKQHLGKGNEMAVTGLTKGFHPWLHIRIICVVLKGRRGGEWGEKKSV